MEKCGLFHWRSETILQTTSGSRMVYLRTLGGNQDEERTDAALAASTIARAELEDKTSQLYTHHIAPLLSLNREGLIEIIIALQRGLFIREAQWKVEPIADPDAPEEILSDVDILSKPDLEDILDWQDERDSLRGELEKQRIEWVTKQVETLQKELSKFKVKQLRERAINLHKAAIIERAYNREWDYQTVFMGSFKDGDCTQPFFSTIQEVRDLPRHLFSQIAADYLKLDAFSRNPESLKNSS